MSIKDYFRIKKTDQSDNGIVVLKKTEPGMCGGTDATQDTLAPKEILSEDMILFTVDSELSRGHTPSDKRTTSYANLEYISAFAAPTNIGTFLFLEMRNSFQRQPGKTYSWAYVKDDIFPSLVKLVRDRNIAKNNGYHSTTHGLPENFGGSVDIRYASGERISFSNNQSPIISCETGTEIAQIFSEAMKGEKIGLPGVSVLKEIRFEENRKNGGFTKAALTLASDGTGVIKEQSRYDEPHVYESEGSVGAETVAAIKKIIEETGILAWSGLPSGGYSLSSDKQMTFLFESGEEITVRDDSLLPKQISRGFFNIELEMTL